MKVIFGILIAIVLSFGGWWLGRSMLRTDAALALAEAREEAREAVARVDSAEAAMADADIRADSLQIVATSAVRRAETVRAPSRPPAPAVSTEAAPGWQIAALEASVSRWIAYADSMATLAGLERAAKEALEDVVLALRASIHARDIVIGRQDELLAGWEVRFHEQALALAPPTIWSLDWVIDRIVPPVAGAVAGAGAAWVLGWPCSGGATDDPSSG